MQGMTHRWERTPGAMEGPAAHGALEPLAARILAARGHAEAASAATFCSPRLTDLHDPSLLPGVDAAAARLLEAVSSGARVAIYADYDVDGVCAAAILHRMLSTLRPGASLRTYIPHRVDEGYGLSAEALRTLRAEGTDLVVSVDCGVTAIEPARIARECGLALIITDHHEFARASDSGAPMLPDADVIVHPRLPPSRGGAPYPFPELCGAAVAFKLAWRLATLDRGGERVGENLQRLLLDLLALAALGTVADVVPLLGENRVIARHGLSRMKSTALTGLDALIRASGLGGERIDAEDVGFRLGPRLNAAGRMGHAREALDLLLLDERERPHADAIARSLASQNERRRETEREIVERACEMAEAAGMTRDDRRAIVLAHDSWHGGVLGIACSRLVDRFHRPVVLLAGSNGELHGSGRSVDGFDLHAALRECSTLLTRYGGHAMAAGLAIPTSNVPEFAERFIGVANERLPRERLTPCLRYDCEAPIGEFSVKGVEQVAKLGPFGRGNPTPLIMVKGLRLVGAQPLGARGAHLELHASSEGRALRILAWGWGERRSALPAGATFDSLLEPKVSAWSGRRAVEPVLKDLALIP